MKQPLLIIIAGLFLVSCATTEVIVDEVSDEINFPDRIASGRAKAYAFNMSRSDSTLSVIDYEYFTPQFSSGVMDSTFKDSVNARIVELASMESPDTETLLLGPLTDYYFERVVNDFTVDEVDDEDEMDMWRWEMEAGFDISETDTYVCLMSHGWSYTGGAHGNGYTFYEYFSKADGLELSLEDFTTDLDALTTIAEKYFREHQEIEPGTSLNAVGFWFENDTFALNDNFYFSGGEMVFVYNSYEIAPYAAGVIDLTIPLSEIAGFVKP